MTIAGADSVGTYYGVQTYLQIAAVPQVMSVTIKDFPNVIERGLVEGFYGNPFSQADRIRQFEFYGQNKMNVYIYSPKDDPYHNSQWAVNYPNAQALKLKELVRKAHENKVKFIWLIHLGGKGVTNTTEYAKVIAKFEDMYKIGVRDFAIFTMTSAPKPTYNNAATNYIVQNFVNKNGCRPHHFLPYPIQPFVVEWHLPSPPWDHKWTKAYDNHVDRQQRGGHDQQKRYGLDQCPDWKKKPISG